MQRRSRETSIFNLSALDLLAMATGTFVLIVVILLPYYRKELDAHAAIVDFKVSVERQSAEAEEIEQAALAEARAAAQLKAEAEEILRAAAESKKAAATLRDEADLIEGDGGEAEKKVEKEQSTLIPKTIDKLDLILVVDTTASMTAALADLRLSIGGLIRILERLVPSLRIGVVAYRDNDFGTWVTRSLQPTATDDDPRRIFRFVGQLAPAERGGPTPREAVYTALNRAMNMPLRADAQQTVILMGDAGPHRGKENSTLLLAKRFSESGARRSVSTLFVQTLSYQAYGSGDKQYYARLAKQGGGEFSEHQGSMIENVLLAVLKKK